MSEKVDSIKKNSLTEVLSSKRAKLIITKNISNVNIFLFIYSFSPLNYNYNLKRKLINN